MDYISYTPSSIIDSIEEVWNTIKNLFNSVVLVFKMLLAFLPSYCLTLIKTALALALITLFVNIATWITSSVKKLINPFVA